MQGGIPLSKVAVFLKDFFNFFYRVRVRSEKIDRLLDNHEESLSAIKDIKQNIETLQNRIDGIQTQINDIIPHLNAIKHGTKMELFETLHNWFVLLVVKRGWASPEEKKEVEEIYVIYHNQLSGNGNGERYYKEIIALPESKEEMEAKQNVFNTTK